jgi:hypothetical protein
MKHLIALVLLITIFGCNSKKLSTEGLKSIVEQKAGVEFKFEENPDSTESLYYVQQPKDLANGIGRFDSAKAACVSYFNNPGTLQFIADNAFFKWDKDGFYAVLVSARDKDSNIVFRITTSTRQLLGKE